ncbi:MAG TPA: SDR family NAD(P)-dependent oxidoreductase [Gammaproteobacteria bacterium]|nr:SDR family NAD(P)-dependent oxidoreductase [Gammaproteobacteria bacterium]
MKTKNSREVGDIAIIGMACRFPGAKNYEEYWNNLIAGKNCVTEIPGDRWNWEDYYGDPTSEDSKTNIKYGGFIENVDMFDPLFFNISPREASYMDPQHRLFLESAWHAIEDAGYNPKSLSGRDIGVYAGVSKNDYAELMRENQIPIISFLSTGTVHSILANRVSYLFDFQGKSEVVDTACSSFLVALDNAVNDINNGFCEAAVVGGVNAILSPTMYISHSKSGMLSEDGNCRSFDAKANGYVRGEGVGVVFIKSLDQALSDNDNILGVIKGSAVKHGGRSNFLTAPKVSAQAATISAAISAANVDPKTIGYIETHGTGTPLGDPIEINALKQAYKPYLSGDESPFCGLTSTKTNVGHLESAAGVAGLIKVLLSIKYKRIPSLLHFEKLNPYIKLDDSPFYIVDKNQQWNNVTMDGVEHPLRAGISSFGMGGVNAHIIVEEPPFVDREKSTDNPLLTDKKYVVPLSAKTHEQLHEYVASVYNYLNGREEYCSLSDVCFTLQSGREALEKRVIFLADDYRQLLGLLKAFTENKHSDRIFSGDTRNKIAEFVPQSDNIDEFAKCWVKGSDVDWKGLSQYQSGNRIQLPAYPFQKKHCWFPRPDENKTPPDEETNEKSTKTKEGISAYKIFQKSDYFIRDHIVKGVNIVPGVKCLDIFQEIGEKISQEPVQSLRDVYWAQAIKVEQDVRVNVKYSKNDSDNSYNLSLESDGKIYCTGTVIGGCQEKPLRRLDIEKIKNRCQSTQAPRELYHQFKNNGLLYGESFQTIKSCNYNKTEILCELKQSSDINIFTLNTTGNALEPSMMDGVFQSVVALQVLNAEEKQKQKVPFYLKSITLHGKIPDSCYVYSTINAKSSKDGQTVFNMYLCDRKGNIIIEFSDFVKRIYRPSISSNNTSQNNIPVNDEKGNMENNILHYVPQWIPRKSGMHCERLSTVIVFDTNPSLTNFLRKAGKYQTVILVKMGDKFKKTGENSYTVNRENRDSLGLLWDDIKSQDVEPESVIYKWNYKNNPSVSHNIDFGIKSLLSITQSLILSKLSKRVRILYLYSMRETVASCLHASVGGFSRTLKFENPHINITSVGLGEYNPEKIANAVMQELGFYRNAPLNEVQYANGQRKVRMIVAHKNFSTSSNESIIKQNGTYLIAGGAGGLGYLFAQYLAENYSAKLILIGRSKKNKKIERKLAQLCKLGGDGQYYAADINNNTSLINACQEFREKGIHLNGVLNCAGLIEDAYIINKTRESFDNVIAPKIMGTVNLDKATKQDQLDFFILFSSIASIMPNQGQCDYAAANSFLDEFSSYRNQLTEQGKRSGRAIAINWPLWKNGGIGVIKEEEDHLWDVFGMKALENDRGLFIFDNILRQGMTSLPDQLIVIEGDQYKIEKHLSVLSRDYSFYKDNLTNEASLKEKIREIISNSGEDSKDIGDSDNLTDYGIDSVGISKITASINKVFSLDVDPTLFFDLNTVSKISGYLWDNYSERLLDNSIWNTAEGQEESWFTPGQALIDVDFSDSSKLIFQKTLSDEEFFMKDHVVEGLYNVPGACYIEMALQAGNLLEQGKNVLKLSNNYWAKQLSTPGDPIQADLRLMKKDDFYEYEITHAEGSGRVLHALGQVHTKLISNIDESPLGTIDFDEIKSRCSVIRKTEEIYQFIHSEGLHVGPSFQPMIQVNLSEREALSHLKLPEFIADTYEDYVLHPSMLTGVLQTALLNNKPDGINSSKFIPIAIDEIIVHKKIPKECYVHTETMSLNKENNEIKKYNASIITTDGNIVVEVKGLSLRNLTHTNEYSEAQKAKPTGKYNSDAKPSDITVEQVSEILKETLSEAIGMPPCDIEADVQLETYGINSVMIVDLNRRLDQMFGNLSKTLFFEYKSIQELAEYFLANHQNTLKRIIGAENSGTGSPDEKTTVTDGVGEYHQDDEDAPAGNDIFVNVADNDETVPEDFMDKEPVAIVGMSGRYPEAKNLAEFWENLKSGRDSISKIPESRFDRQALQKMFPDKNLLPEEWGGFLDDIDKFDPLFFNISPREASIIDPQERMFLEVAWESIEDAGYNYRNLQGKSVGVFVGALWQPYISLGVEQTFKGNLQRPHGLLYSIANRVSFFFDWCGPSLAVDTACSASLTALHLACESLKRKETHSAIVGGVNISLSSSKYLWLSNNNFLSSDGKCRSFGSGGDGYVPGEGVGAVYLKRLKDAIRDGDHIYGLIKGTSINHGGKTNGYTVPNPVKQTELILSTLDKSGISPEVISYVEAHGTGTSLGDPIEITGLQKAFSNYTDKKEFCAIGSVKSNIGHLEAAAGIAGLTKLLLQLKHKTLVPSINADELNPNIDFSSTPFIVQKELKSWGPFTDKDNNGQEKEMPLRAMLSSFGAGGSNAHAIIEEYRNVNSLATQNIGGNNKNQEIIVSRLSSGKEIIIPLSAKTVDRLKLHADNLLNYIEINETNILNAGDSYRGNAIQLEDIAFTLQTGREEMDERVVFLVKDVSDLKDKLRNYISIEGVASSKIISGNIGSGRKTFNVFSLDNELNNVFDNWIYSGDGLKIATLWINGIEVNWDQLYHTRKPEKVSLPTYPFRKDRYWIAETDSEFMRNTATLQQVTQIHPLLHENTSDLYAQRYSSTFTGKEAYFEKSRLNEEMVLSSMAYLEMVHAAISQASGIKEQQQKTVFLSDVEWLECFTVKDQRKLHITLTLDEDLNDNIENVKFEIYSAGEKQGENSVFHARGCVYVDDREKKEVLDITFLLKKMSRHLDPNACDEILGELEYIKNKGKIKDIYIGGSSALIKYESYNLAHNSNYTFTLNPDSLETVLTAAIVVSKKTDKSTTDNTLLSDLSSIQSFIPMMLGTMNIYQKCSGNMFAWIKNVRHSVLPVDGIDRNMVEMDVDFIDSKGYVCARAIGLGFESMDVSKRADVSRPINHFFESPTRIPEKPTAITLLNLQSVHQVKSQNFDLNVVDAQHEENYTISLMDSDTDEAVITDTVDTSASLERLISQKYNFVKVLSESLARALYMELNDVDIDRQFTEMGLDSIVGVEWINELNQKLSLDVNATIVYDYPTIRDFARYLENKMASQDVQPASDYNTPPKSRHRRNKRLSKKSPESDNVIIPKVDDLQKLLAISLAKALYMDESDINIELPFIDMGLDSIVGVEWIKVINDQFNTSILATAVYDHTNLREFSRYLEKVIKNKVSETSSGVEMVD